MHKAALLKVKKMMQQFKELQSNLAFPKTIMKAAIEKAVRRKLKDPKLKKVWAVKVSTDTVEEFSEKVDIRLRNMMKHVSQAELKNPSAPFVMALLHNVSYEHGDDGEISDDDGNAAGEVEASAAAEEVEEKSDEAGTEDEDEDEKEEEESEEPAEPEDEAE